MRPNAIVYTSRAGHTRQYAQLLGKQLRLVVYALEEAIAQLTDASPVIYLGWIHASRVKGYARAAKRFSICAVCGVGLCDTGTLVAEVRKASSIPQDVPLFTLQGGIDRSGLKGMDKLMISMHARGLAAQKQRSSREDRMLELLSRDESYVRGENLAGILQWYRENSKEKAK